MPFSLLKFLIYNRKGDRIGRATKVYLILWAIVFSIDYFLVHGLQCWTVEQNDPWIMGFALGSFFILPFNRLDK